MSKSVAYYLHTYNDVNGSFDAIKCHLVCRDGFEDTMFEAKARSLRGQSQGEGQSISKPRPSYFEAKAKVKAKPHRV